MEVDQTVGEKYVIHVYNTHTRRVEYVTHSRLRGSRQLDAPRTIFRENRNKCREFSGMGLYESVHRMSDDGLTTGKMTNDHPGWGGELNFLLPGFFFFFVHIIRAYDESSRGIHPRPCRL